MLTLPFLSLFLLSASGFVSRKASVPDPSSSRAPGRLLLLPGGSLARGLSPDELQPLTNSPDVRSVNPAAGADVVPPMRRGPRRRPHGERRRIVHIFGIAVRSLYLRFCGLRKAG